MCKVAGTPAAGYEGTYPLGFTANPGSVAAADGATAATSGTLNLKIVGAAPTVHADQYFLAVAGKPFCFDFAMDTTDTLANGGLPLTNLTAGTTPANVTGYGLQNVNLVAGTAQICGTASSSLVATTSEVMAPVATNSAGSVTGSIVLSAYDPANWVTSGGKRVARNTRRHLHQPVRRQPGPLPVRYAGRLRCSHHRGLAGCAEQCQSGKRGGDDHPRPPDQRFQHGHHGDDLGIHV